MNYIIEILDEEYEIITTKKTYTIEEIKEFYINEFKNYRYRIYKIENINILELE